MGPAYADFFARDVYGRAWAQTGVGRVPIRPAFATRHRQLEDGASAWAPWPLFGSRRHVRTERFLGARIDDRVRGR